MLASEVSGEGIKNPMPVSSLVTEDRRCSLTTE